METKETEKQHVVYILELGWNRLPYNEGERPGYSANKTDME
jgi:hypothetical protein